MQPKWDAQYGKKTVDKYASDIVQMFDDGLRDKTLRSGSNRILECLAQMYLDGYDLPSEAEI